MPAPLFSIILPVYNAAPYLDAAIASLLGQDYTRFEIIAIDDGSTDGTLGILERYAWADPRIRLVSRENRGLIATLNQALGLARGDLIARMDADDISYPRRLSMQAAAFEANPKLALCGTSYDEIRGERAIRNAHGQSFATHDLRVLSLFFTLFPHASLALNRKVIDAGDLHYDPAYPGAEDFDLIRRVAAKYSVARIETPLLAYRVHADNISHRQRAVQIRSHLTIVAENLAREQNVDTGALAEVGAALMQGRICAAQATRVAECFLDIEKAAERVAPASVSSYRLGVGTLFHDLFCLFRDHDPALLEVFLARTNRPGLIRRRERAWLSVHSRSRMLGHVAHRAVRLAERLELRIRSVPLAAVLPEPPRATR